MRGWVCTEGVGLEGGLYLWVRLEEGICTEGLTWEGGVVLGIVCTKGFRMERGFCTGYGLYWRWSVLERICSEFKQNHYY